MIFSSQSKLNKFILSSTLFLNMNKILKCKILEKPLNLTQWKKCFKVTLCMLNTTPYFYSVQGIEWSQEKIVTFYQSYNNNFVLLYLLRFIKRLRLFLRKMLRKEFSIRFTIMEMIPFLEIGSISRFNIFVWMNFTQGLKRGQGTN